MPNLSTKSLSIANAIATRQDDAFAAFRTELRSAVDQLEQGLSTGRPCAGFVGACGDRRCGDADAVPLGPAFSATAGLATAVTAVGRQWLMGRRTTKGVAVGVRYFSMVGGAAALWCAR
nr:hypothetical protein GCM10017745_53490 [Saccharothrix mutabilis subsp. capreolus]